MEDLKMGDLQAEIRTGIPRIRSRNIPVLPIRHYRHMPRACEGMEGGRNKNTEMKN
jgi:hypothetical protein